MANRTMQQKTLKLKRQLRKLPRRIEDPPGKFTEHSGTPIPARMKAEGVKAPMRPQPELMKGYKHRAKSLSIDEIDDEIRIWERYKRGPFQGEPPGRFEAKQRILQLNSVEETDAETRRMLCISKFLLNRQRG